MATDEEITQEAEKLYDKWVRCDDMHSMSLLKNAIKKGIQMERKRIWKQVKENLYFSNKKDVVEIKKIDIWDDVK